LSGADLFKQDALDQDDLGGVVVYSRNHVLRDFSLNRKVERIKRIVLFKTRAIVWLWFAVPLAVAYILPESSIPLGFKGWIAYIAWVLFGMMFYRIVVIPFTRPEAHPREESHRKGFAVGYQPDFWQWKFFEESREDLNEISNRLEILPRPTMAIKSISPNGFGMVCGTENPGRSACVIFPTKPSDIQWGFSRKANRGVLAHECGHVILETGKWMQQFTMVHFVALFPLTLLFTYMLGQIADYQGVLAQDWQRMYGWFYALQVPLVMAIFFGLVGERIISRIHEFGCDAITAVCGEGEGLVEAFEGFKKFTKQMVAKKPWDKQLVWYLVRVPYREVFGTHPNLARRNHNLRAYMR